MEKLRVIGLAGLMGSGKSTISAFLKDRGVYIIDADKLGHQSLKKGSSTYNRLLEVFGPSILKESKEIDRKKLAEIVFRDENSRLILNSITHSAIKRLIKRELKIAKEKGFTTVVLEAAILLDSPWIELVTEVWEVRSSYENCLARLIEDKKYSPEEVKLRLKAQIESRKKSNFNPQVIIINDGCLDNLYQQAEYYFNKE